MSTAKNSRLQTRRDAVYMPPEFLGNGVTRVRSEVKVVRNIEAPQPRADQRAMSAFMFRFAMLAVAIAGAAGAIVVARTLFKI
jgi:hypothetical protein